MVTWLLHSQQEKCEDYWMATLLVFRLIVTTSLHHISKHLNCNIPSDITTKTSLVKFLNEPLS